MSRSWISLGMGCRGSVKGACWPEMGRRRSAVRAAAGVADSEVAEGLGESAGVAPGEVEFALVVALGLATAESEGAELGWPDSAVGL